MKRNERIRIGFLVHDVSRLRRTAFDQRMKPLGITRSQWWVLTNMTRHGDKGITQTELATVMDIGKVALGGLIDRLEDRGFIERRADPEDRRVNRLFLRNKGHGILERMNSIALEMNAKVMRGISLQRQHALAEALHDMKVNLIALDALPVARSRSKAKSLRARR
jgi:DNA-binding MarR family transcriptional regulator